MKRNLGLFLDDLQNSIVKVEKYTRGVTYGKFKKDDKTIDAVIRNLEIMGEAAKNIPKNIKDKYPAIPWRAMIGMRNKVIHEYFGVDVEILWETLQEDIPALKREIKALEKKI